MAEQVTGYDVCLERVTMGDVISLNKFKKKKERAEKAQRAAENRLKHGKTKTERAVEKKERELADKQLDGHKLEE